MQFETTIGENGALVTIARKKVRNLIGNLLAGN
jgi:hypothetical protein